MKTPSESPLYHHAQWGAYECMGCRELIEIPALGVLAAGRLPVRIKTNPENLLIWVEMIELDHAKCSSFKDAKMAQDARLYRKHEQRSRPTVVQPRVTA